MLPRNSKSLNKKLEKAIIILWSINMHSWIQEHIIAIKLFTLFGFYTYMLEHRIAKESVILYNSLTYSSYIITLFFIFLVKNCHFLPSHILRYSWEQTTQSELFGWQCLHEFILLVHKLFLQFSINSCTLQYSIYYSLWNYIHINIIVDHFYHESLAQVTG